MHENATKIVSNLTLPQKASLLSGKNFWELKAIDQENLESIMVTDGPHGLRKQAGESDHLGINKSVPATCYPAACATASSFDPSLIEEMGKALGENCIREKVSVLLGPGTNIKRNPLCGRNFEYFSEDPYLSGKMAAGFIKGVQSKGIGTSLKHFAANNQETARMVNNSVVDMRTLRELYLAPFEIAVKEAQPWTVMCSYNKINGEYSSDNKWLLTDVLRDEWGFQGLVVSDWGALNDPVKAVAAGMDLEMPFSGNEYARRIVKAVEEGRLEESAVDACATRVVELILKSTQKKKESHRVIEDDHQLARKIAGQSAVLLKNEGVLPLKKDEKIAFIGEMAQNPRYQGAGSSKINPTKLDNAYEEALLRGYKVSFAAGYSKNDRSKDAILLKEAVELAKTSDKVVIFAGLPDEYESEGYDRTTIDMPISHNTLINKVSLVNPNVVVVLQCGSAVSLPWKNNVSSILLMYLSGQAGGSATVDLLWGDVNPSGKLPESFICMYEDNASAKYFPGTTKAVSYREGLFVGYRYYEKAKVEVNYPFGYGLSYTSFSLDEFKVEKTGDFVTVQTRVTNTGDVSGAEVVQVYVGKKKTNLMRPVKELKGFQKVFLLPGDSGTVSFSLPAKAFRYYDIAQNRFLIEEGEYEIYIATSSKDIFYTGTVFWEGETVEDTLPEEYKNPAYPFTVSDAAFEKVLGYPIPKGEFDRKGEFNNSSCLMDMKDTWIGKLLIWIIRKNMDKLMEDNADEGMENAGERMVFEMPIRALTMTGTLGILKVEGIVAMANGHFFKGLGKFFKKTGSAMLALILALSLLTGCDKVETSQVSNVESNNIVSSVETSKETETNSSVPAMDDSKPIEECEAAFDAVANMQIGWNLGNTFDSTGDWLKGKDVTSFETGWGNPIASPNLFEHLSKLGFKAVRLPVTWRYHIDEQGNIDEAWLSRVEEVVNLILDNDMYCIINVHHDTGTEGWLRASTNNYNENKEIFEALWTNIATRFEDYPDRLLFEGFNEMLDEKGEWNKPGNDSLKAINMYNQLFVDAVRATGGKNATRNLIVNAYAASNNNYVLSSFEMPIDKAQGHLIAEVHSYAPWAFTSTEATWTNMTDVFDDSLKAEVDEVLRQLDNHFIAKGIPCIIGEFGSENKNNLEEREKWAEYVISTAKEKGVTCFYWDNGASYQIVSRYFNEIEEERIANVLIENAKR